MPESDILIRGARVHNLRNVSLSLPRNRLIVFTGVSGSGKSSLAFDTLFAEGQRRYVQSLSSYARQFLDQLEKPDVDFIGGLSPSISIEQKSAAHNPRSTVGTVTEVHDFLRVLFARIGTAHCIRCGQPIGAQTREEILARLLALPAGSRIQVLAPVARAQKGEYRDLFAAMRKQGFVRARVDGRPVELSEHLQLDRQMRHDVEIVVDRLVIRDGLRPRLAEAVDQALALAQGTLIASVEGQRDLLLSASYACAPCGLSYPEPTPQLFSFNSPQGMCPTCSGLGTQIDLCPDLMLVEPKKSIRDGAIDREVFQRSRWLLHLYEGAAQALGFRLDQPWNSLTDSQQRGFLYGTGDAHIDFIWRGRDHEWRHGGKFEGLIAMQMRRYGQSGERKRRAMEAFMRTSLCPECRGERLRPDARAVRVGGLNLPAVCRLTVGEAETFFRGLTLGPAQLRIAEDALKEIRGRLRFLMNVGLHYLTLDRSAPTLSGGEAQRIRMASQVGCGLVGVTYILDEPSIGLHPRDNAQLIQTLRELRDAGNTVIVVEHDEETIRAADHVVDFGPGPGVHGGHVVAAGKFQEIVSTPGSITAEFLDGQRAIPIPASRRQAGRNGWLTLTGARHNNLKNITVRIPLQSFTAVTGVSGSGKSSVVCDILWEALARDLNGARTFPGAYRSIRGTERLRKVVDIDQSPIGRTPRSNPATYVGVLDPIRDLLASLPEARVRGYRRGRFSFNVRGGRCEACEGHGCNRLEMDFLADVWVTCPVCSGRRFNRDTLAVRFKGRSIADLLDLDVQEALEHFENIPPIRSMLQTMADVGLGYLKLGQPSTTLSGGEAQRIKLAEQLVRPSSGGTLYILDEPTTGLHFADVEKLLQVLQRFVDAGNTVVVVEHNLEVVKCADYVIDLGPEGGEGGGRVVATGPPEAIALVPASYTGQALRRVLHASRPAPARGGPTERRPTAGQRKRASPTPAGRGRALTEIRILGASQHNLKHLNVSIPRDQLTVFSGVSGSGKSSLALDTIYAEGQRRYVESLSAYARQFLGQMPKPKVESVSGLSPAIAIEQKAPSKNPRSTVGTVTEIYEYLRVLWARLGRPHCTGCGSEVSTQTSGQIVSRILSLPPGTRCHVLAPVEPRDNEDYEGLLRRANREGYPRARVDGQVVDLGAGVAVDRRRKHRVEILLDRLTVQEEAAARLAGSVEAALELGGGVLLVQRLDSGEDIRFSQFRSCPSCGTSFEDLTPRHFAFNTPLGWCAACEGLGVQRGAHPGLIVPDPRWSVRQGAITLWGPIGDNDFGRLIQAVAKYAGFSLDTPFRGLDPAHQRALFFGLGDAWIEAHRGLRVRFLGLFPSLDACTRHSWAFRRAFEDLVTDVPCHACGGGRIRPDAAAVRFQGRTLPELCRLPIGAASAFFSALPLPEREQRIAGEVLREITHRLRFLVDVGLDYLTLDRAAPSLSGGEAQRIRLASQIGSGLTGVLYVLDEPTIGLHPRDNRRLLAALEKLRDLGNTLIVVEHDRETLERADHILDFGPEAGEKGGHVVGQGNPDQIRQQPASLTGQYLAGQLSIDVPTNRRVPGERFLEVVRARHNNLRDVTVRFPLGLFIAVTGVSGSGKTSLVFDVLYHRSARDLHRARTVPGAHDEIRGLRHLNKVISIDQSPIGFSPRSDPATYVGVFDEIRDLYAALPESKMRGYTPRRFSFNQRGGRCEACWGYGARLVEMHFLPDVWIECETCRGSRYNPETLAVRFKGRSIADVLRMSVREALEHFRNVPRIRRILQTLDDVGLGYLRLGQSAPTLSGGEAQRVRLAAELARPSTGRTLYLLDEPTTGLHFADIAKLLAVLNRLVDAGNTVVFIEHNLEVIKTADWILDLGPEGGDAGGRVVAQGAPEDVALVPESHTGRLLREVLARSRRFQRPVFDFEAHRQALDRVEKEEELCAPAAMPWQADGRQWHLRDRLTRQGDKPLWDPKVLARPVEHILSDPDFEAHWGDRDAFSIGLKGKRMPFFIGHSTGRRWAFFKVRIPRNYCTTEEIAKRLALPTFNDLRGYPCYGDWVRVWKRTAGKTFDEVSVCPAVIGDVDTPAMRQFLAAAMQAFKERFGSGGRARARVPHPLSNAKARAQHLQRRERQGQPTAWEPEAILAFERLSASNDFLGQADWSDDTRILFPVPKCKWPFAEIDTSWPDRLAVTLRAPKGEFQEKTLARALGFECWIEDWPDAFDRICLFPLSRTQVESRPFRHFLRQYARSFRRWQGTR
ncbi:MAG: excinuclease ABC subunit UvrA [Planctomycetes bacterium]|nr:excinuclease ABC subunit UvrA [Planctomycetota bacterium]